MSLERRRRAKRPVPAPSLAASLALVLAGGLMLVAACGSPTSGKTALELYDEHCTRCHGADGRGDRRALTLSPNSDLVHAPLVRGRARGAIFLRISQGYGSMPAFSHKLQRGDIELLVDHVLELGAP